MERQSIIIVGAGAAGLMAANQLSATFNVTVLEARNRIGGRINTLKIQDQIIEGGAEFIHGNLPVTLQLLKDAQINYVAVKGEMYRKKNGGFVIQNEILNDWNGLLQKMKTVKRDMSLHQFLQKYYSDNIHYNLRKQVIAYAEGFDLADIDEVSVKYLYKEWSGEDEINYRITTGYAALTNYLYHQAVNNGCTFLTDKIVQTVNWNQNYIAALTADGQKYEANKILITIPLKMIYNANTAAAITFNPLINLYTKAAKDIGIGSVIKIVIKFKEIFWQTDAGFILSDAPYFSTWWTQLPDTTPILTGWMGGKNAKDAANFKQEDLKIMALESLSSIFNIAPAIIRENIFFVEVFNWDKIMISPGAYSFDTLTTEAARAILTTPLFKTIFLAGEALYSGEHPGTVEAALVSGQDAVLQIKNSI